MALVGVGGCLLARNGDMGVRWVGAGQQWRHGCVLARDGDMCVGWVGAGNQWRHGCVLARDENMGVRVRWVLVSNGATGVC